MKLFLPVGVMFLAAGACCCCGDLGALQEQFNLPAGGAGGFGGGGAGASATASIPQGHKVTILDINSEDAYYSDRSTYIGRECTTDAATSYNGDGWHGGPATCGTDSVYFYKAALLDLGAGAATPAPTGRPTPVGARLGERIRKELPSGARVKVAEIHSEDAYYSDRASIVGKQCTLQEASSFKDGAWHGGSVQCDDGSSYYFYKAGYEVI